MEARKPDWTFRRIILELYTIASHGVGSSRNNRVPESKRFPPNLTQLWKDRGKCSVRNIDDATV